MGNDNGTSKSRGLALGTGEQQKSRSDDAVRIKSENNRKMKFSKERYE
jgi:hypothetical protein